MSGVCCSTVFVSVIDSILLCIYIYIYIYIILIYIYIYIYYIWGQGLSRFASVARVGFRRCEGFCRFANFLYTKDCLGSS